MKKLNVPAAVKTALVTGGDGGIGFQFARNLAYAGVNIVLVSNRAEELQKTKVQLKAEFSIQAESFYCDMSQPNAAASIYEFCKSKNMVIDLLVNNAGVFFYDEFIRINPKKISLMMNLHMIALTELCYLFGRDMAERQNGFILNVSSMSAWMAVPGLQLYAATKSYIQIFSRSIYYEMKRHHVGVTVICPGGVDTPLYHISERLRKLGRASGMLVSPEKLSYRALKKTFRYRQKTLLGAMNHVFTFIVAHLPKWMVFAIMRHLAPFKKKPSEA